MNAVLKSVADLYVTGLTFDEALHQYRFNGVIVPSVTQILSGFLTDFSKVSPEVMDYARELGTNVHLATELYDKDVLDETTLDPVIKPYLSAWQKFLADHDTHWDGIECRLYHPTHRYAGTADRVGFVNGVKTVLDIKTGGIYPSYGPQTAAYAACIDGVGKRLSVHLANDGTYKKQEYSDRADWSVFLSCLSIKNFLEKHK